MVVSAPTSGVLVGTELSCVFNVSDVDGDVVSAAVQWFSDGEALENETGVNFTVTGAQPHLSNVTCEVTPTAKELEGTAVTAEPVFIGR